MAEAELDLLVVECMERMETEGSRALDALCTEHPQHAAGLRAAIEPLVGSGLIREATPRLAPGAEIGGYEILREVGRGGMGVVFEARDPNVDRTVALKVLRQSAELDDEPAVRFRREARAAGALRHPGLVQVHTAGVHEGQPWIAMEFVDGTGLDVVLDRMRRDGCGIMAALTETSGANATTGPGELRRRVELILQVADALEEVQRHDIVHRDIKPSNIFLRPDGRAVLGDFGLARRIDAPELTRTGAFAGTPYYASPEQVSGTEDVGPESDVFSLGITLYELLTLERPFQGGSTREILNDIATANPTDPAKLSPNIPEELAAITLKALAGDRSERYASAAEFAADLRAFLEFRPVSARRTTWSGRLMRWARREPLQLALALVLVLGGLSVAVVSGFYLAQRPLAEAGRIAQERADADTLIAKGFRHYIQAETPADKAAFERALDLVPDDRLALIGRVLSEVTPVIGADGGGDPALRFLSPFLQKDPDDRVLQRLEMHLNFVSRHFDRVQELNQHLGPPRATLEYFIQYLLTPESRPERKAQLLDAAIRTSDRPIKIFYYFRTLVCAGHGDALTASTYGKTLTRLWPDASECWMAAGNAALRFAPKAARKHCEKAMRMAPDNRNTQVNWVRFLVATNELDTAEEALQKCREVFPDDLLVLENLAFLRNKQKRYDEAIELAIEASARGQREGKTAIWRSGLNLAVGLLRRKGDLDRAIELLREAVKLEPKVMEYQQKLLRLLLAKNAGKEALQAAEAMVRRFGDRAEAYVLRAQAHETLGDNAAAIRDLEKCQDLQPKRYLWSRNLAAVYSRSGDKEAAVVAARRAVELSELRDPISMLYLGEALLMTLDTSDDRSSDRDARLAEARRVLSAGLALVRLPGSKHAKMQHDFERVLRQASK